MKRMEPLTLTLIVIFAIISLIPFFSRKTGFPVVVAELIAGIILGKSFLNLVPTEEPIIKFLSSFGLTYLMFLAGLEVSFGKLSFSVLRTIPISISSLLLPFTTGMYLSKIIQANPLFLGSVFSTTSLSLTLPLSKEISYEKNRWKDFLLVSVILVDIISMFVLAFSLTLIKGPIEVSFFYSILAVLSLFLIPFMASKRKLGEKIESWISKNSHFETGVRLSFALIL
ncbi:MAG TPA: cation:proton antiporter, partial [Thermofilum sp.]|nr:cation:proton antiporter [Thermofilum sp.]